MIFPRVRRANAKDTNTKYTNTAYDEVPERPNKWHIFENSPKYTQCEPLSVNAEDLKMHMKHTV